eukprot:1372604-Amphidinium_carterae.2
MFGGLSVMYVLKTAVAGACGSVGPWGMPVGTARGPADRGARSRWARGDCPRACGPVGGERPLLH